MKEEKIKSILFYLMIVVIILLSGYLINYTKTEGFDCLSNPLVYGVDKFKSSSGEFTCLCGIDSYTNSLLITKDEIIPINNNFMGNELRTYNFSGIKLISP